MLQNSCSWVDSRICGAEHLSFLVQAAHRSSTNLGISVATVPQMPIAILPIVAQAALGLIALPIAQAWPLLPSAKQQSLDRLPCAPSLREQV